MLRADMEEILVGKVRAEAKPSPVETLQTPRLGYRSVHFCDEALLLQNLEVCSGT